MYFAHLTKPGLAPACQRDHVFEGHQQGCLSRFCQRLLNLATLLEAIVLREILLLGSISRNALASGSVPGIGFVDSFRSVDFSRPHTLVASSAAGR
jgi:hypothetical protein